MKSLVLAEKPSVGRDIARVLNCKSEKNGYIEGNDYIVTWAMGHLVTLAGPEAYQPSYKDWKMEDLPIIPQKMKTEIIKNSSRQFKTIKSLVHRKDISQIIIATDAGREGELVARWILEEAGCKKGTKRLWISSVTDKAIRDGFNNLKDGKKYQGLYLAAKARAEADWIVGINGTRALTVKYNAQLSCGRVQTPTLAMINIREEEIKNFKPRKFYGLDLDYKGLNFKYIKDNNTRFYSKEEVEKAYEAIKNKDFTIKTVEKKLSKKYSSGLYNLTELQRDANNIFAYSPKETLSIMQSLYERHKFLTYPRTDSKYISEDLVPTLEERIKNIGLREHLRLTNKILTKPIKADKSYVDNNKVTDHHGIIPTEKYKDIRDLSIKEKNIYNLVVKRFLSVFLGPFKYEQLTIKGEVASKEFISKGQKTIELGFREAYVDSEVDQEYSSDIIEGERSRSYGLRISQGKTSPPESFTEGSLIMAMENPKAYMSTSSKELKEIIQDAGGIGTVATRADIIDKLFASQLMEKVGKHIKITSKGSQLLDLVPEELKSPELTASWEKKLNEIEKSKLDPSDFILSMEDFTRKIVKDIKNSNKEFKHDNLTKNRCKLCGEFMLEIKTRNSKLNICQDRSCGYKETIETTTNARCPNCKKKLSLRGKGEGKYFVCSCGHRENYSNFIERRKDKSKQASKREVNKFLKKQDEEDINSDLKDALAKFKFD